MSPINVMDESYIAADRSRVAGAVADPSWWSVLWPELQLTVTEDRGLDGVRWAVTGRLTGTAEVWLEDFRGRGVIVHYFLRVDQDGAIGDRRARRLCRQYTLRWKEHAFALKDALESAD
ncbi:MAG TPA: polyketide cyclase / dehydrase and lipid transport [Actinomycetes bacterium]|nr:polyketide cyclase / dehydrase and lipid transport [Actinomycetes bacterium]